MEEKEFDKDSATSEYEAYQEETLNSIDYSSESREITDNDDKDEVYDDSNEINASVESARMKGWPWDPCTAKWTGIPVDRNK